MFTSAPKSSLTGNSRRWPPRRRLLYSSIWSQELPPIEAVALPPAPGTGVAPPAGATTLPTVAGALIKWPDLVAQSGAGPELDAYLQARNINRTATLALHGRRPGPVQEGGRHTLGGRLHRLTPISPRTRPTPRSVRRSSSTCASRRAASGRRTTPASTPQRWPSLQGVSGCHLGGAGGLVPQELRRGQQASRRCPKQVQTQIRSDPLSLYGRSGVGVSARRGRAHGKFARRRRVVRQRSRPCKGGGRLGGSRPETCHHRGSSTHTASATPAMGLIEVGLV